jgi:hypothetical protein
MLKFIATMYVLLAGHALLSQEVSRLPQHANEKGGVIITQNESTKTGAQEATATPSLKADALPEAPSAQVSAGPAGDAAAATSSLLSSPSPAKPEQRAGTMFWTVTGIAFASTVANVEVIARCVPTSCQSIPPAIRSRGALYGIGIPASAGVSYLGYRMKRDRSKWWFLPATILTQANLIYAVHSAPWMQ